MILFVNKFINRIYTACEGYLFITRILLILTTILYYFLNLIFDYLTMKLNLENI